MVSEKKNNILKWLIVAEIARGKARVYLVTGEWGHFLGFDRRPKLEDILKRPSNVLLEAYCDPLL